MPTALLRALQEGASANAPDAAATEGPPDLQGMLMHHLLDGKEIEFEVLGRGYAWLDTGTHDSLLMASNFIQTLQDRQGTMVSCPEEVAWSMGFIDSAQLRALAEPMRGNAYGLYLLSLLDEAQGLGAH